MTNGDSLFLPISKRGRGLRSSWLGSSRGYFENNSVDARDLGTSLFPPCPTTQLGCVQSRVQRCASN